MGGVSRRSRGIPREIEIIIAVAGLLMLSPLLIIVAAIIKITSAGPACFRQTRVGRFGNPFTIYKFRSMRMATGGVNLTSANDQRVTWIGRLLRRTKIDELPQLWNVIRGDMSLVGPRPEVPEYVDLRNPLWQEILEARPGLTDPVTLRLRNEEHLLAEVDDKEAFYIETLQPFKIRGWAWFVRHKTWKTDLRILGRTFLAVVFPGSVRLPTRDELKLAPID